MFKAEFPPCIVRDPTNTVACTGATLPSCVRSQHVGARLPGGRRHGRERARPRAQAPGPHRHRLLQAARPRVHAAQAPRPGRRRGRGRGGGAGQAGARHQHHGPARGQQRHRAQPGRPPAAQEHVRLASTSHSGEYSLDPGFAPTTLTLYI